MDLPAAPTPPPAFPWRLAAMVAGGIAAVELILLVVVGGALIAKPTGEPTKLAPPAKKISATGTTAKTTKPAERATATAALPRRKVRVLVLNGNGRTGAAATAASTVDGHGYKVSAVANAPRMDYPQSIVLFRRGFEGEAQRLAKDVGVQVVGPLDGMKTSQLHGAHLVFILGA
jgi:hypothetical protein